MRTFLFHISALAIALAVSVLLFLPQGSPWGL